MGNEVIIEFTKLNNSDLNKDALIFYENQILYIKHLIESISSIINIDKLEKIIIPDDYSTEVVNYQELIGYKGYTTNNQFSKAVGQMLKDTRDPHNSKYVVFLSYEIANFLVFDEYLDILAIILSIKKEDVISYRFTSNKLFVHELVHIHEAELVLKRNIELLTNSTNNVYDNFNTFANTLWKEYYASRISASIFKYYQNDINSIQSRWTYYETNFVRNRYLYNLRKLEFDVFCNKMFECFRTILIELMYYLADLYSLEETERLYQLNKDIDFMREIKLTSIILEFYNELDCLFKRFESWQDYNEFNNLSLLIQKYYRQFYIIFSDSIKGLNIKVEFNSELYDLYPELISE